MNFRCEEALVVVSFCSHSSILLSMFRSISALVTFLFSVCLSLQAQDSLLTKARTDVTRLTSEAFAGRGYVDNGHVIAAEFIRDRMIAAGLSPVVPGRRGEDAFFQPFEFTINLVQDGQLVPDGIPLAIGEEFIVNKYSGSGSLEAKVIDLGYGLNEKKFKKAKGKIVVFRAGWPVGITSEVKEELSDLSGLLQRLKAIAKNDPVAIIILQPKLTHGFVAETAPFPILEVLESAWPEKVKYASLSTEASMTEVRSQNVIGQIEGTCDTDKTIVICAHYDHLGKVGDAIFTGANDNASGITMMLSMMDHFSQEGNRPEKNLLFIAFGAEEVGLIGSRFYAYQEPVVPLSEMDFLLNLDLMGNGVGGIMAVGGKTFPDIYDQLVSLNDELEAVPKVRARPNAPNSDHYWFLEEGVKGFFIYTLGGPPHYHDVFDTGENLELSKYVEVRELLIRFLEETQLGCEE